MRHHHNDAKLPDCTTNIIMIGTQHPFLFSCLVFLSPLKKRLAPLVDPGSSSGESLVADKESVERKNERKHPKERACISASLSCKSHLCVLRSIEAPFMYEFYKNKNISSETSFNSCSLNLSAPPNLTYRREWLHKNCEFGGNLPTFALTFTCPLFFFAIR